MDKTFKFSLIWVFIFLLLNVFSVNSTPISDTTTTYTLTNAYTIGIGYKITARDNLSLINLTVGTNTNASRVRIINGSDKTTVLYYANITSKVATFNYNLTAGTTYYLVVDANGGNWVSDYMNGPALPIVRTNLIFNTSGYTPTPLTENTGSAWAVTQVTTENISTITLPASLNYTSISLVNASYINTSIININTTVLNTSTNGNVNQTYYLYYNNGTIINNTQFTTNNIIGSINLSGLSDNVYKIWFYAINNQTNTSTSNYTFTKDTTAPTISNNISLEINVYNTTGFNSSCTDTNLLSCNISINNQNIRLNTTSFNFTANGNMSYNITALDLAGNSLIVSNITLVNPYFYVYFNDSNGLAITNFSINSSKGLSNYTNYLQNKIYNFSLGVNNFTFIKSGYSDLNFSLTFNTTSAINTTLIISNVYIIVNIYDITNGSLATPNNYTLFYYNENSGVSTVYTITNNNTIRFFNIYDTAGYVSLILQNSTNSIVSTRSIINPRVNVTIPLYLTTLTTIPIIFQVYDANFIQIPNTHVYLYVNIGGTSSFPLETSGITDVNGQVIFNIVPNRYIYNICEVDSETNVSTCLNQKVYDTIATKDYIQRSSSLNLSIPVHISNNIQTTTYDNKTIRNTSQITFGLTDLSAQVTSFCFNVSRFTNNTESFVELKCFTGSSGQLIQSYNLSSNQYIHYTFLYYSNSSVYYLGTLNSYYEEDQLGLLKASGILDLLFLILFFCAVGGLLYFRNKIIYSLGILTFLFVIILVQTYLTKNFVYIGLWVVLLSKHLIYYYVGEVN